MDVFGYIKQEETAYQTQRIRITDNWDWNMFEHVERSTNMLNSIFWKGNNNNFDRPYMQAVLEPLNLQKALLDFGVKDAKIFAKGKHYGKSFAIRKFHEDWANEEELDMFFGKIVESFSDYGGALVKKTKSGGKLCLEVVPLQRLAFCDQTDIKSGPKCEKHQFSPDQLREYDGKWDNIEEVISLSSAFKTDDRGTAQNKTPGHYIPVYELHGMLPETFHDDKGDPTKFDRWMYVTTFYKDENGDEKSITLYSGPESEDPYDFVARDEIYGRALGRGGIEEQFHPQIWMNWSIAQMKSILEMAGKMIFQTADQQFAITNVVKQLKTGAVLTPKSPLTQVNNTPQNLAAFENMNAQWDERGKRIAAAYDSVSGASSTGSHMNFRLAALLQQQGKATHQKRKKTLGLFVRRLYRNWIIPYLLQEIQNPKIIRAKLTNDELERIVEAESHELTVAQAKDYIFNKMDHPQALPLTQSDLAQMKRQNRRTVHDNTVQIDYTKAFCAEMKGVEADIDVTLTDENKNLAAIVDQLSGIFQMIGSTGGAVLAIPGMTDLLNEILEYGGLSPIDFSLKAPEAQPAPAFQKAPVGPTGAPQEQHAQ
jgi:hypothetical protein